jgi:MFS family permease
LAKPAFLWLLIGSVILGFAAAPFYAFATPFLIRIHGFTASEAGLAFGLPQGLMGVLGAILAGRGFDRAVKAGRGDLLRVPAIVFLIASVTTLAGLFAPAGWMAVALFVPSMFSFAFLLPYAFGSGHLVAGEGNQAVASSLAMIGSGLLGPALGPLIAGMVSDAATAAQAPDGLRWGMLIVPVASLASGVAMLVANRRVAEMLGRR